MSYPRLLDMFNKFELVVDAIMRLAAPQVEIVEASSSGQLTDAGPEWTVRPATSRFLC